MLISDWSSDVCSSDLLARAAAPAPASPPSSRRPTRRRGSTFSSLCSPLFKESIAVFRRVLLTQTYNSGVIRQSLRLTRDGAPRIDEMVPFRGFTAPPAAFCLSNTLGSLSATDRSEELHVGQECIRMCRHRG